MKGFRDTKKPSTATRDVPFERTARAIGGRAACIANRNTGTVPEPCVIIAMNIKSVIRSCTIGPKIIS